MMTDLALPKLIVTHDAPATATVIRVKTVGAIEKGDYPIVYRTFEKLRVTDVSEGAIHVVRSVGTQPAMPLEVDDEIYYSPADERRGSTLACGRENEPKVPVINETPSPRNKPQ
jgi:hypothetical protein